MPERRRSAGALVIALVAMGLTGCVSSWPPPSCGEYTLDRGERIPQVAVDCMSQAGEDGALRVIAAPDAQGYVIATTYRPGSPSGIQVTTEFVKDNGARFMKLCPDAVSVVDLGECEELHEGH